MANLPKYRPETLSLNPAFLKLLSEEGHSEHLTSLTRIIIGGALSDNPVLEKAFNHFEQARFLHLYGGSEAEPVSFIDAKIAREKSLAQGFYQTLCVGQPIPQIKYKFKENILWVHGPNVAGEYIGDVSQNLGIKEKDSEGHLWHCMNDRILMHDNNFWFHGRGNQRLDDFILEQQIYTLLQKSDSFICRENDHLILIGENVESKILLLKEHFPQIEVFINAKIERDARHRSRINRDLTIAKRRRM